MAKDFVQPPCVHLNGFAFAAVCGVPRAAAAACAMCGENEHFSEFHKLWVFDSFSTKADVGLSVNPHACLILVRTQPFHQPTKYFLCWFLARLCKNTTTSRHNCGSKHNDVRRIMDDHAGQKIFSSKYERPIPWVWPRCLASSQAWRASVLFAPCCFHEACASWALYGHVYIGKTPMTNK